MTIFEILSISEQSTWQELTSAYEKEQQRLQNLKAKSEGEGLLLEKKRQMLQDAYESSRALYPDGQVMPVKAQTYQKARYLSPKLYGIPGPFLLGAKIMDGLCNPGGCCSCSCCNNEDCFQGLYEECGIFGLGDTIIMGGAAIAAVVGIFVGIGKIIGNVRDNINTKRRNKMLTRQRELNHKLEDVKNEVSFLEKAYAVTSAISGKNTGSVKTDDDFTNYVSVLRTSLTKAQKTTSDLKHELADVEDDLRRH